MGGQAGWGRTERGASCGSGQEGLGGQGKKFTILGNEDSLNSLKEAAGIMASLRSTGSMTLSLNVHALIQELVWSGSRPGQFPANVQRTGNMGVKRGRTGSGKESGTGDEETGSKMTQLRETSQQGSH